jgi:hypothetical protein
MAPCVVENTSALVEGDDGYAWALAPPLLHTHTLRCSQPVTRLASSDVSWICIDLVMHSLVRHLSLSLLAASPEWLELSYSVCWPIPCAEQPRH